MWSEKAIVEIAISLIWGMWYPHRRNGKILKLWGSIAIQLEHLGFLVVSIFFRVLHYTGNNIFMLNQAIIKEYFEKKSSKTFPMDTRSKKSFLTSTTAVDTQQMSNYKVDCRSNQKLLNHYQQAKIMQSISLIHQIICEMHLILDSYLI